MSVEQAYSTRRTSSGTFRNILGSVFVLWQMSFSPHLLPTDFHTYEDHAAQRTGSALMSRSIKEPAQPVTSANLRLLRFLLVLSQLQGLLEDLLSAVNTERIYFANGAYVNP